VHLDVDAMLLQPLDELFEQTAELVYTTDVNMANKKNLHNMPVQVATCTIHTLLQHHL
jgi:alpha-N-acetylglucosamine transferase